MAAFPAIPRELAGYWDKAGFETATYLANAYGCEKEVEEDVVSFLGAPGTALAVPSGACGYPGPPLFGRSAAPSLPAAPGCC